MTLLSWRWTMGFAAAVEMAVARTMVTKLVNCILDGDGRVLGRLGDCERVVFGS